MAIRWFDGFKNFKPSDILNRLNIESDGTLTVDGKPIDTGSSGSGSSSSGGGNELTLTVKDYFSGSTTVTKTYTDNMMGFDIANDGSSDLTFTINSLTLTVKSGEVFSDTFEPFTSVTITSTVAFRAYVKAPYNTTVTTVADTTPPTITASPVGGTFGSTQTITLSSNETANIYYTLDGSTPTTSSTKYSSPISISTTTTVKYFGIDTAGNQSTVQSATYTIDTVAPNNVTNLTVGTVTATSIPLTWTLSTSTDVANYEVAYMPSGNANYTVASNAINSSSTSYTINGLTQNTHYTVRVVTIDQVGNRSTGVTTTATTAVSVDTTPPNNVTNLTATNITATSLTLNWKASTSTDIASYDVYQGATLLGNTTNTTYGVTGLSGNTSYTFDVKSKDTSGNVSSGNTITVATSSPQPVDTTPPIISVSPSGGTYTSAQSVSLSANETATIYYTTNGTTPTTSSSVYSSPISITGNTTLEYFGVDAAGNSSTVQTATYTIQTAPNYLPNAVVYDSFNRADNSASLGISDSGHTWVADSQVWGISGDKARPYSGTADRDIYIDSGKSDCSIQVTFASPIGSTATTAHRLMFRWNASGQCFVLQATTTGYTLYMQNGSWSSIGTSSGVTPKQGDVVKVVLSGSSITCFVNGTQIISVTNTNYQTATKHGLAIGNASTTTIAFDDFSVA